MRLKRLNLKAFGPFTDRTLEFDSEKPGLHIVFGPNEAGKSTSLRALKALLYGFPERTPDNFQHANDQLLVGGCLQGTDGRELAFLRRKKRKADLLDLDGNPLDPGMLAAFLHGIEPALFESLYGIDHKTLVAGGEDILAQKGEVGQALFAAGAGISSLRKILDTLDAEAEALFKKAGTRQQITLAIKEYKDLKKIVKDACLPSSRWQEHTRRLQDAEAEQARLEEESRRKNAKVRRLVRLSKAIPELANLENLQGQLRESGEVVVLAPEFSEQLRQVEQSIRETRLQLDQDRHRRTQLRSKQAGISLDQKLLDQAAAIEDLHQRIGAYRNGLKDRIRLDGMRITHRKDAGALIEEIRPDFKLHDAESLRPVLGRKRTIQDLSSRHEALTLQAAQARKQKDAAAKKLAVIGRDLSARPAVRECESLTKAMKLARHMGDIDGQIEEISREIETGKKSFQAELQRLGLWAGDLDQLPELALPLVETVRRFETAFSELDQEQQQLRKDRQKATTEVKTARAENQEIAYGGEVPAEQDLNDSRQQRQEGWQLLLRQWVDGEDIAAEAEQYGSGQAVHKVYERHVTEADHIADRLRREAERVAKAAALRARIERLEETIDEILTQEQQAANDQKVLAARWRAEWESVGITPLSPREMLAWLTDIDSLRFKVTKTFHKTGEEKAKAAARHQYRQALVDELQALGVADSFSGRELAPVLVVAESVVEDILRRKAELEKLTAEQLRITTEFAKAQKEQEDAEEARAAWQHLWNRALAGLGLQSDILPSEALDLLETIGNCLDKLAKAKEFQIRIDGIDRDAQTFSDDVQTLLTRAAPELRDRPPDQAALQLHTMLGKARQNNELLKKHEEEEEALTAEIANGEKTLHSLDGLMTGLLATAKCDKAADLAEAIRKSRDYLRLQEKISEAESSLTKVSEGVPLAEISRQAGEVDVDELPGQIASLNRQVEEELYLRIKDISKIIGEENRELQLMDGSAKAAEAAETMEQIAARIRRLVAQYTRVKLAAMVLKSEIERYREEHQDPVLQRASRLFSELTLGAFTGLRTDVDDKGESILIGMRGGNVRVSVDGMSSGTRDQLYLALRLATLEWRLKTSEPMPFIVDDILINFDDDRSRATLAVLSELAEKNQVILFTHHRQIVEAAKTIRKSGGIYVYEL